MSTVDPVRQRAEREAARRGGPARIVRHIVLQLLQLAAAIVFGTGLAVMADQVRVTELNSVFGTWDSGLQGLFWTFPVGLTALILLGIAVTFFASTLTGRPLDFPVIGPASVALVGVAIGFSLAAPHFTPPDRVGIALDPTFGDSEPWGAGEWIWYRIDVWGPLLLWGLAVAAIVVGAVARRRRRARRDVLTEVAATGARVPGEVTEAPSPDPHAVRTITRITVRYTDQSRVERWVEPTLAVLTRDLPRRGDAVAVVYDRSAPGDTTRVFVGPADARTADDFRRWNLGT